MIIDKLTLHNFKVYKGQHTAVLTPPSQSKTIVLFGGLNGGGKTSILEALQLALYGKLAPFLSSLSYGYSEYLKRSIHNECNPNEGASVAIAFRSVERGEEHEFHIHREWASTGSSIKEVVDVFLDGQYDPVLSDTWIEQVERFIPVRLSNLFFFDGERIESLANPKQSASLLSNAINSLLGVDLVERLKDDLLVLNRRKSKELKTEVENKEIEILDKNLKQTNEKVIALKQEAAELRSHIDLKSKDFNEFEESFIKAGGQLGKDRDSLKQQKTELEASLKNSRQSLIELSSGPLPLLLTKDLLNSINSQAENERSAREAKTLDKAINARDKRLLRVLTKIKTDKETLDAISKFISIEEKKHEKACKSEIYLELAPASQRQLTILLGSMLYNEGGKAKETLDRYHGTESTLDNIDRKLVIIPDTDELKKLNDEFIAKQKELEQLKAKLSISDRGIESHKFQRSELMRQLEKAVQVMQEASIDTEDTYRLLKHSELVRNTLTKFRINMIKRNVDQLEKYILDGYLALLRKKTLISRLEIEPDTCKLNLYNPSGRYINPDQISAGERQLLAVSMLWSLGKAAGRPLPVVIDTPLGRLDGTHRHHMVNHYFPNASHQVLLLSTDEEIDEDHYKTLKPYIGHTYTIDYDDEIKSSCITPGYFWQESKR